MAYIGMQLSHNDKQVRIKLHGPFNNPQSIIFIHPPGWKETIIDVIDSDINWFDKCEKISESLIDKYGDGEDILWVETEIVTQSGLIFGATAEKVLVS